MMTQSPARADLLIRHGYVLTMDLQRRVLTDGAIAIVGKRIADVDEDGAVAARWTSSTTIDAHGGPVHPGLIEGHLHASYQLYRGAVPDSVAEDDVFDTLERRFYDVVTDDEEYLGVVLSALEMMRNGTTCFMEAGTVLEPSAAAQAAQDVGIRAVIGDARVVDPSSGGKTILRSPRTFEEAIRRLGSQVFRNADPEALVTGHVTVHGLGTSSEALLLEAKRRADEAGVVLNTHHAYSDADLAADRARYGADPLVHLAEIGVLDRNVTLGHANLLTDLECDALAVSGASVVWAPAAAAMWGHRGSLHGRHAELWRRGVNVCFGSDSGNWSNDFDLFRQANLALLSARALHANRTILTAEDVLDMATRAAARATGLADRIGSIEHGKRADLVIHTLGRPELSPP
jgi:5-methylthioadenosine/S-adenosylhomocysteine deaminase